MANISLFTIGLMHVPYDDPQIAELGGALDAVWRAAEAGSGFIAVSKLEETSYGRTWGPLKVPSLYQKPEYDMRILTTFSLWENIESVFAYTYNGLHAHVLGRRREWFLSTGWPGYVAWWVADDHTPTWVEACERYDKLYENGPTADAFDFKHAYNAEGQRIEVDRESIKYLATQYSGSLE